MRHVIVITIFLSHFFAVLGSGETLRRDRPGSLPVEVNVLQDDYQAQLEKILPESFAIGQMLYQTDGLFSQKDFEALTGLTSNQFYLRKALLNSLFYVQQMGLFDEIVVKVMPVDQGMFDFHVTLKQHVLLDRLKVTGFLRSKQQLRSLYSMDPGDVFDRQKHEYGIEQMKVALKDQGYLNVAIHDLILPENSQKAVVVRCAVVPGRKFVIDKVAVTVESVGQMDTADLQQITQYLQDFCVRKIQNRNYNTALLTSSKNKMHAMLRQQGFIHVDIVESLDIDYQKSCVGVTFALNLEKKREYVLSGNNFFKKEQILDGLLLYGKSTWYFPSSIIKDEILQLYRHKGFFEATVSVKEEDLRLFCFIQEGRRSAISGVVMHNMHYLQGKTLVDKAFKHVLKAAYYDKDLLKKAVDELLKSYKSLGFWDVKIVQNQLAARPEKARHYVYHITLSEGTRRLFGDTTILDYPEVQQDFVQHWGSCTGRGFDKSILLEQKQWLIRYFKNKGYQNTQVSYQLSDVENIIDVQWNIKLPESAMKFGKTIILGSTKVPYSGLMKEIAYQEGDDWDKSLVQSTLKNLKELSVFESVQVYPGKDLDEHGYKPMIVKVIEAEKYEIKSRFGLQQVGRNLQPRRGFTYKIGASFGVNQLFSAIDKLSLFTDITRFYRNSGIMYDLPWIRDKKIRCQLKLYDAFYQQPVYIGSQDSLYQAGQQGFLWNMARSLGDVTLSGSVGIEYLSLYEADQPCLNEIICYQKDLLGKRLGYVFMEPTVLLRRVDNELSPMRGYISLLSCRGMVDFQNYTSFCKVLAEHTQYIQFLESSVLAIRLRLGHVFNRCFDQIHPIERFYLGGAWSLRGYERDYCPPLGLLTKPIYDQHAGLPPQADNWWRYAPQGGRTMFNANFELRCGVYKGFGVALFSDFGALFQDSLSGAAATWRNNVFAGSGVGLRYNTPVGPLRADFGVKWKSQYQDFESSYVFYLTLGQAF